MIESEDNAENKIYHVISAAILKNANLGTFPMDIFGKLSFSVKKHVLMILNLLIKPFEVILLNLRPLMTGLFSKHRALPWSNYRQCGKGA